MNIAALLAPVKSLLYRLRYILLGSTVILLLAVGGAYGWKVYTHRQSPEYALEKINQALLTGKRGELAALVNFRSLALDFAQAIYDQRPQTPRNAEGEAGILLMADQVQLALFKALEQIKDDKPVKIPPEAPLAPLPQDFLAQIAGKLRIHSRQDDLTFVRAEVDYGRAQKKFPILLLMELREDGWRITRLANARDMVALFVDGEKLLQTQREDALAEKNADEQIRMDAQFQVNSCTAAITPLSNSKTVLLTIQIMGHNRGEHSIHNMNLIATLTLPAAAGQPAQSLRRHVNLARKVSPGENLTHTYNVELDPANPEDARIIKAPRLQCQVRNRAMTLSSGAVLHIRD